MQDSHPKQWIKPPESLNLSVPYIMGLLLRKLSNDSVECELQTERGPIKVSVPLNQSFQFSQEKDYADMCDMNVLNQPEVLSNIIRRYKKDEIFTSIGPTLIIVNPYRKIDKLFNQEYLERIREKISINKIGKEDPHVYLVAGKAFLSLRETDNKQAIVISGESGAGKTESTKYCMQFLTSLSPKKNHSIEEKILACNPLLEAFGNSKTVRNENSSRFGKYVKIYFNEDNVIKGANIHSYLLQKSRVVSISPNQRSFHSFYALTASGRYDTRQPSHYTLLKQSGCYHSSHIDDKKYFEEINAAFKEIGFSDSSVDRIWTLISTILKLGNIDFDEANHIVDQSKPCDITSTKFLNKVSSALDVETKHLEKILLFERKKFLKQYTLSPYNKQSCRANRNTICKALYNAIFEFILFKIEHSLKPQFTSNYRQINILDIFGFQNFEQNSFEQFCINFTNQKLLKLYNIYVFDREMQILKEDGLQKQVLGILPPTNDQIIHIISGKLSLFSIINDMTLPQFKDEDIMQGFHRLQTSSLTFDKINKKKFCLIHTQCSVVYNITGFKAKNQDKVNEQILDIVCKLFQNNMREQLGKTILSKFSKQIEDLVTELNTSSVHFIRCIKPNELKQPNLPDERYILTQIRYLGIFQTIMIRRNIFPFRKTYREFYRQFRLLFPIFKKEKNQKVVTEKILKEITKKQSDYLLGNQRVYINSELQDKLNNQIFKFLKIRNEKIRKIQIGLKRCILRKKILSNLHTMATRIRLLKLMPGKLEIKAKKSAYELIRQYYKIMKEKYLRQKEENRLNLLKEAKKLRQQQTQRNKEEKLINQQSKTPRIVDILSQMVESVENQQLNRSFILLKSIYNSQSSKSSVKQSRTNKLNLSVDVGSDRSKVTDIYAYVNRTQVVGDSVIDMHAPYTKPETPSSQLIGKTITFNEQFMESMKNYESIKVFDNSKVIFQDCFALQPASLHPNPFLQRLKNILSEKYKVNVQGNQEDFFSPLSMHCNFRLEDLPQEKMNEIIDFPVQSYFNKTLRKRTTFLGSKKTYQEILVYKKGVLNKSMTLITNPQDEKKCLHIFKQILKIGEQMKIEFVIKYIECFIQECQNSSLELKNETFVQLIRQSNASYQLTAIRIYQTMAVYLHVYNPSQDLLKATLNIFYWKLQDKKTGISQAEYLRYVFSILMRKIQKRTVIGYLPLSYQIMGLMCKRQISIPVYLPTGNSIMIRVQSHSNFFDIKEMCIKQFGINRDRLKPQYFTFFQVVNFDNEDLEETPIKQTNMVWDMMTYWELTKSKYLESDIQPPNFFLMFKIRYCFQVLVDDQQVIEMVFSQLSFDYFMGKIKLEDRLMYYLGGLIEEIKYSTRPAQTVVMGVLPIWFMKKTKKEEVIKQLKEVLQDIKSLKYTELQLKFKFNQICDKSPVAMAMLIPSDEQPKLHLKTRYIILQRDQKYQIISLRHLVKWSIEKQSFQFQVLPEMQGQQNRTYQIRTDAASVCNQFLKCVSQLKTKVEVPNFKKK